MIVAPKLGAMSRNKADVATDTVTNLIQNRAESNAAKQNGLTTPVYGNTFDEDRRVRSQNSNLANDDNLTAPTSTLRLSDDEVIANALARQEAKGFNGLNVSWTDSPAQQNAKNGGLNVGYSTARDEGVEFESWQYMKGMPRTAGAGDVKGQAVKKNPESWGGKAFNDYVNNAFTRDRLLRADALFTKVADIVLQNKETIIRNSDNRYRMSAWDGKRPSLQTNQIPDTFHYQAAKSVQDASILAASIYSLPVSGTRAVLMYSGGAGLIGGGTNAAIQYIDKGTIDLRDVANATVTNAAGAYLINKTGSLPLYAGERMAVELVGLTAINVTGAVGTTYIKNQMDGTSESLFAQGSITAVSTLGGYYATKLNPNASPVTNNFASSLTQELISVGAQKTIQYIDKK